MFRRSTLIFYLLGAALGLALFASACWLWQGPRAAQERVVVIAPGSGPLAIGRALQRAGVVRSAAAFRWYAAFTRRSGRFKAGEYAFPPRVSLGQAAAQVAEGRVRTHAFTIPEGFTLRQIAEKLEAEGLCPASVFMQAAGNSEALRALGVPADTAEGFLFPDTYQLARGLPAPDLVALMVRRFFEKASPALRDEALARGLDLLGWVTLASMIEREVRVPEERAKASSVFYNRLARRMRLESCATVLYAQGRLSGTLLLKDLETPSPYNTYKHRGLPPGPISNPGLSALEAAARPAQTDYLFFVVTPEGDHVFSKDYSAHLRAKSVQDQARRHPRSALEKKP